MHTHMHANHHRLLLAVCLWVTCYVHADSYTAKKD